MRFIFRHCKYLIISMLIVVLLSIIIQKCTPIPQQLWIIATIFIGYVAAKLDERRQ